MVVDDPVGAAKLYQRLLMPKGEIVQLGDNLHLRDDQGSDLAFHRGSLDLHGSHLHFGFLAGSAASIDDRHSRLQREGLKITDECTEEGFRSIKFCDPWGDECEVY